MFKKSKFWTISLVFLLVLGSVFPALAPNIVKAETPDNDITEYIENEDVEKLKPYFYSNSLAYKTNDGRWLVVKDVSQVPSDVKEFTYLGINNCDGQCMLTLESKDIFISETKVLDFTEWTLDGNNKSKPNFEVLQHKLQADLNSHKPSEIGKDEALDKEGAELGDYNKEKEKAGPQVGKKVPYKAQFKVSAISNDNVDSKILEDINKDYKVTLREVDLYFSEGLTHNDDLRDKEGNRLTYKNNYTKECEGEYYKNRECTIYEYDINKDLTPENNEFELYFSSTVNNKSMIDVIEDGGFYNINAGPQKSHIVMDTNVKGDNEVRLVMLKFSQKDIKNIDFYTPCVGEVPPLEPSEPEKPEETQKCEPTISYSGITFLNQNDKNSKLSTVAELEGYAKNNNSDIIKDVDDFEISAIDKTTSKVLYKGNHKSEPFKLNIKYNLKDYPIENVEFKLTQVPDGYDLEDYHIVYGIESKSGCEAKENKITRYLEHGTDKKLAEDIVGSEFAEFKVIEGYAIPSDISKSYKKEGNVRTYYYKALTILQTGDGSERRLPGEVGIPEVTEPAKPELETPVEDNEGCCEELVVTMYILASPKEMSCDDYLAESDNLKKQIDGLQNKIGELNKEIEKANDTKVEELKKDLSKIEEELKDLQSRKTELDNQFSECNAHAGLEPDETEETTKETTTSETTQELTEPSEPEVTESEVTQPSEDEPKVTEPTEPETPEVTEPTEPSQTEIKETTTEVTEEPSETTSETTSEATVEPTKPSDKSPDETTKETEVKETSSEAKETTSEAKASEATSKATTSETTSNKAETSKTAELTESSQKETTKEVKVSETEVSKTEVSEKQSSKTEALQTKVTAKAEKNLKPVVDTGVGMFGVVSGLGLITTAVVASVVKNKKDEE